MKHSLAPTSVIAIVLAGALLCDIAVAGVAKTGPRGGTATGQVTQQGNKVSGSATAATAGGKTAAASGTATVLRAKPQ